MYMISRSGAAHGILGYHDHIVAQMRSAGEHGHNINSVMSI